MTRQEARGDSREAGSEKVPYCVADAAEQERLAGLIADWVREHLGVEHVLCELQAGHLGAHRSGLAQWMRGRKHLEPEITDEPLHGWEYGHQVSLHTGTTIHPVADENTARTLAWLHPVYRRHAPGPWVPVGEGEQ